MHENSAQCMARSTVLACTHVHAPQVLHNSLPPFYCINSNWFRCHNMYLRTCCAATRVSDRLHCRHMPPSRRLALSTQALHDARPRSCGGWVYRLHVLARSMDSLNAWWRASAGASGPDIDVVEVLTLGVAALCEASAALTVDLYCGGVLSAMLRVARRLVAAQAGAQEEEETAGFLFHGRLAAVVTAFGRTVPQARAHKWPAPAA